MNWWMVLFGMHFLVVLFLGSPLWVSLVLSTWLAPSEVLMGGWLCLIFPLGSSMPPCAHFLVWILDSLVLDSVVHKLNPVQHERLHLWMTSLACWIFWGKLYCARYSFRSCLGGVCLMAYIMLHCWYNVPFVFYVWCLWCTLICYIMNDYSCPRLG